MALTFPLLPPPQKKWAAAIRFKPQDTGSGRHLKALEHLSRCRIDAPYIALLGLRARWQVPRGSCHCCQTTKVRHSGQREFSRSASARVRRTSPTSSAALPGNPYDGHTLATVIPAIAQQIGVSPTRIIADKGYRGYDAPPGRRRSILGPEARRHHRDPPRAATTGRRRAKIDHLTAEHRMGRNHLAGRAGDAVNALLAAVGYNFPA